MDYKPFESLMKLKIISLFILLTLNLPTFSQRDTIYGNFCGYMEVKGYKPFIGIGYFINSYDLDPSPYGLSKEKQKKSIEFMCDYNSAFWPGPDIPFEDSLLYIGTKTVNKSDTLFNTVTKNIITYTDYNYKYKGYKLFFSMNVVNSRNSKSDNRKYRHFMNYCIAKYKVYVDQYMPKE